MTELRVIREIDPEWKCRHSGDCCKRPPFVYMTTQEADLLRARMKAIEWSGQTPPATTFEKVDDKFERLKAAPCPFLTTTVDGHYTCGVYSIRPYNCRRFGCQRPDPSNEPWEDAPATDMSGLGVANLIDRLRQSRVARRIAVLMQRKAQKWALKNGWGPE